LKNTTDQIHDRKHLNMAFFPKLIKIVLFLTVLTILPQPAAADRNIHIEPIAHNKVSWTDLTFKGSKLLTTITVKMHLGSGELSPSDPAAKSGTYLPGCSETDKDSRLLTVKSSTKGMISQGQHDEYIWFKEPDGLPYKRIRVRNNDDPWIKSYCWEKNGVRRHEIQPGGSAENKQSPTNWTKHNEHFYEHTIESAARSSISEPSLIFYILSILDPDMLQNPKEICAFGRKQLHRITIRLVKSSRPKLYLRRKKQSKIKSRRSFIPLRLNPWHLKIRSRKLSHCLVLIKVFAFTWIRKNRYRSGSAGPTAVFGKLTCGCKTQG
jgi:hypothetical protein